MTYAILNLIVQKPNGAFLKNLIVYLDRSRSHFYNGLSIAFWRNSDLSLIGSTVTKSSFVFFIGMIIVIKGSRSGYGAANVTDYNAKDRRELNKTVFYM